MRAPQKCHFCCAEGSRYMGGGFWVCFVHWLKLGAP